MNKRLIRIVILFTGISLMGIVALQFLWIRNALKLREEQFDRDVTQALQETVRQMAENQEMYLLQDRMKTIEGMDSLVHSPVKNAVVKTRKPVAKPVAPKPLTPRQRYFQMVKEQRKRDSLRMIARRKQPPDTMRVTYYINGQLVEFNAPVVHDYDVVSQSFGIQFWQSDEAWMSPLGQPDRFFGYPDQVAVPQSPRDEPLFYDRGGRAHKSPRERENDSLQKVLMQMENKLLSQNQALTRMMDELRSLQQPLALQLDVPGTREMLARNLDTRNITLPFEYAIISCTNDTISRSVSYHLQQPSKTYQTNLFPERFIQTGDRLDLYFPGRQKHILGQVGFMLAGSLAFTLLIVSAFISTVLIILRQKKISEVKSDFINNMTHEFKTPIATISLATDAIVNPKVLSDSERVRYYTGVIREENRRMNHQVESILKMALLEKKDFGLKLETNDLHELIGRAIEHVSLQIEKRGGKIVFKPEAANSIARVDEIHFINVMYNLLDNANKYSPEIPRIAVATRDEGSFFVVEVADQGMGMDKETQQHVFEKFYRKSTGNIHNVKGFGLGLSYVKAIVEATGGLVSVKSEPEKGSCFTVKIPISHE
ncbi:MAG: HAMP domain-containing sensor histidine kinase [Bacteroidales bacterium]|nr:HAMP domain-containing sensor histidine kinase [Bacteroidales bacterium]MDD3664394.1 HAMP domain-containing sensor histidine kinase [Bacteroidales bacterium]